MNPWIGMATISLAFAGMFGFFCRLRQRGRVHPELSRKGMHVGMGLLTLSFPWLFHEAWPVLLLGGILSALLLAFRCLTPAKARFGGVLGDVNRVSWGELYFVAAVCLVFVLTRGQPWYFVIPILVLTLADAGAAVAGVFYGRTVYTASDGLKTWEGTTLFFLVSLLISVVPLGWSGVMSWERAALAGLCIGLLSAMIEAGSWRGLDNLLLPLGVLGLLRVYSLETTEALWGRVGALAILALAFIPLRRHVLLHEGSLMGALVLVYLCWVFGGWRWVVGPLTLLAAHPFFLRAQTSPTGVTRHTHPALLSTGLPALGWLMLSRVADRPDWYMAFSMTLGAQLAMSEMALWRHAGTKTLHKWRPGVAGLVAWLAVIVPAWRLSIEASVQSAAIVLALALCMGVSFAFGYLLPRLEAQDSPNLYWAWRAALASTASIFLAAP